MFGRVILLFWEEHFFMLNFVFFSISIGFFLFYKDNRFAGRSHGLWSAFLLGAGLHRRRHPPGRQKWLRLFEHVRPFLKWNLRFSHTAILIGVIRTAFLGVHYSRKVLKKKTIQTVRVLVV